MQFFGWLEATAVARSVGESLWLTASLSALHVIGFTLVMGGGLVTNLRFLGAVLRDHDPADLYRSASRVLLSGLAISLVTGSLLFSPRAADAVRNGAFELKITLLLAALIFHFAVERSVVLGRRVSVGPVSVGRPVPVGREPGRAAQRVAGAVGASLWTALAVTACWFILFE